jgi:hypothetical protein
VKTKNNRCRRNLSVSGGFLLALLLSDFSDIHAEDQAIDNPIVEPRLDKKIPRNEHLTESDTIRHTRRHTIPMVGPSGEEIHDFLYPMPKDEVVTSAN